MKHALTLSVVLCAVALQAAAQEADVRNIIPAKAANTSGADTTYAWPTGEIHALHFKKGQAIQRAITTETELYVIAGSLTVGVGDKVETVNAGDAVFRPSGALRNAKPASDVHVLVYNVGTLKDAPAKVIRASEVTATPAASWTQDGKMVLARKDEEIAQAPSGAAHWMTKLYDFGGNAIRVVAFAKGGASGPGLTQADALVYVAEGSIGRVEGPESAVLKPGDAVRVHSGLVGHWEAVDTAVYIHTNAPAKK